MATEGHRSGWIWLGATALYVGLRLLYARALLGSALPHDSGDPALMKRAVAPYGALLLPTALVVPLQGLRCAPSRGADRRDQTAAPGKRHRNGCSAAHRADA